MTLTTTALSALATAPALLGIDWLDPETLLKAGGWIALVLACAFVFLETGVLVLAFLPGDSLLFTVGLFSATGIIDVPIWVTCTLLFICAFAGDQMGFMIGRTLGPAVFSRERSRFFNPENVARTHVFFEKHGPKAIIIARFLPVFRAFVPAAAGVGKMEYRHFVLYNAVGALLWGVGVTLLGYFLGQIPFVREYSEVFIIVLVLIPGIPILIELFRALSAWRARRRAASAEPAADARDEIA
ncbi:VTT domain-containing protein [Leucobacter chromiiresistens]|uniref:Membrane-associated protein n=1 Tax=Leucobacter chromiiresistens TaxID=1079994 RepID=A0A1H0YSC1_9MICO|nr:VTT domain-containing protein [Leucobacter chromiiresistens]SDQ18069.1 membrane-associated protein [Leucobacter chromiiresistens]